MKNTVLKFLSSMLFYIMLFSNLGAQNPPPVYNIPNLTPPTPTAQAFQRYGEIPVDYSTGTPSINIPLYTITSRRLSVPLSLSYHASGIKVADMSNDIGLGWSLQGKTMITRTVIDRPDDGVSNGNTNLKAAYITSEDFNNAKLLATTNPEKTALSQVVQNDIKYRDRQSDRFSYQLPGKGGGVFRYDFITGEYVSLPFKPGISVSGTTITDETGTIYTFQKAIRSYNYEEGSNNTYTSWYITSIETPDKADKIEYVYTSFVNSYTQTTHFQTARYGVPNPVPNCYGGASGGIGENTYSVAHYNADEPLLDEIISATTRVKFEYVNDRIDIPVDNLGKAAPYRLNSIKIYDRLSNTLVKEISLQNNSYFDAGSGNKRLKLNGISFKDKNGQNPQTYTVNYETGVLPSYTSFSQDFWGYYNGAANGGLIPSEFIPSGMSVLYGGNRRPDHSQAKACMIKEIVYPTGGKTTFDFEPNSNNQGLVGGFRIKKISSTALSQHGEELVKTYAYEDPVSLALSADKFRYLHHYFYWWPSVNCGPGNGYQNNVGLFYEDNIVQSSSVSPITLSGGTPVVYTKVTEFIGTNTVNTGKSEYYYSAPEDTDPVNQPRYYGNYFYDKGNYEPRLLIKLDYKKNGPNYDPIKEIKNIYTPYRNTEHHMGVNVVKESSEFMDGGSAEAAYYQFDLSVNRCCNPCAVSGCYDGYLEYFSYYNTKANEKIYLLTKIEEKQYDANNVVNFTNTTDLTYGDFNQTSPTYKFTTSSKGVSSATKYQYTNGNLGDNYAVNLSSSHIWSPLLIETDYKNDNFLRSSKTYYTTVPGINSTSIQVPSYVETKQGVSPTEIRLRYHKYDSYGNVLEVSKENDVHETYLYGYNSTYCVAKITGTTHDIAKNYIIQSILDNPTDDAAIRSHLNNLRNIAGALVTTYTYKPLIGITSETDPNGKTIYYEYDAFSRLTLVRDKDNNILKKICYNYAGQQETCSINAAPQWQATGNLNCVLDGNGQNTGYQEKQERDVNANSATYNALRWVDNGYNLTACPLPVACDYNSCTYTYGEQYACSYGQCEQGFRVNTDSYYDWDMGLYACTYHYEFSDGSWSSNYTDYNYSQCPVW